MKNLKRTLSIVLALVMSLALTTMAFAQTNDNTTLKVENGSEGSSYAAYQIMSLRMTGSVADGTDKYNYVINEKYGAAVLAALTQAGETNVPSSAAELTTSYLNNTLGKYDAEKVRTFANELYEQLKDITADKTFNATEAAAGVSVPQGYYLVIETGTTNDMRSLVMLDTAGNSEATITVKKSNPVVDKKVDANDATVAYVGQILPFTLKATLTDYVSEFKEFNLYFQDTMSAGLTLIQDGSHPIKVELRKDGTDATKVDITATSSVKVEGQVLKVAVRDLQMVNGISKDSTVIVSYYAQINDNASYGDATSENTNTVNLIYSNDPYWESDGHNPQDPTDPGTNPDPDPDPDPEEPKGETDDDGKTDVITIRMDIAKTDGEAALAGADFTLWRWADEKTTPAWEKVTIKEDVTIGTTTDFVFGGIGVGVYRLIESTVPDGRVQMEDRFFKVEAEAEEKVDGSFAIKNLVIRSGSIDHAVQTIGDDIKSVNDATAVAAIKWSDATNNTVYTVTDGSATASTTVINEAGVRLPATGGAGTTMLYIIGAIVLVCALGGCYIYMRKRNAAEQ